MEAPFYLQTTIAVSSFVSSPNLLFEETAGRLLPVSIISTRPVVSSPIKRESPSIAGGRPFIAFQRHHPYHRRVAYTYALSLRSSSENTRGSIARSSCQLSFARFFTFSLSPYIGPLQNTRKISKCSPPDCRLERPSSIGVRG